MQLGFGRFDFDNGTRLLLRQGQPLHLTPLAFNLLEILLLERPKAVAKRALMERLWPDVYVAETNLASLAAELRQALGDSVREPRYLRTVHRFGYAFCGEVHASGSTTAPAVEVHHRLVLRTREVALSEGENVLGRNPQAVAVLDHASVSRSHASIVVRGAVATLEDLGSKNGTFVQGNRLSGPVALSDGDELLLGTLKLIYRSSIAPPPTETARGS